MVFERDGYLEARLTDITAEAHCSTGSFYTYFDSKEALNAGMNSEGGKAAAKDLMSFAGPLVSMVIGEVDEVAL